MRIDGLQYCNFSEKIFRQMRIGEVDSVHVTICYHENFRETVANLEQWNRWLCPPRKTNWPHGYLLWAAELFTH